MPISLHETGISAWGLETMFFTNYLVGFPLILALMHKYEGEGNHYWLMNVTPGPG